ncbi:MAG: HAD-IIA family hydrolase [Candidatus Nanopelagicales bacterium]
MESVPIVTRDWGSADRPLSQLYDVALLDLDGVVYVGQSAVAYAPESLAAVSRVGMRCGYVTNNASRPPEVVAAHLRDLGIVTTAHDVVNSAQAGARLLGEVVAPRARILYIGGPGVPSALNERGYRPVTSIRDDPAALIQGYGKDVGWEQLAQGSYALHAGLPWVATNTDRTIPTKYGRALGNGAMVAALRYATGAVPLVAGKPEPPLMMESVERMDARTPLVIGDRLDTDIRGANKSGIPSLLVLTGVTDWPELVFAPPLERPTFLADDLRGLLQSHPGTATERSADCFRSVCATASVTVGCVVARASTQVGPRHWADVSPVAAQAPSWLPEPTVFGVARADQLDGIRATVAAAWAAADAGMQVVECRVDAG